MGTTAQKLTYLNDTKSQLKTMISYGYPLTNETFRQYVGGVFKALINSMPNTTNPTWNNLPKITTTPSTSLSINNTIEAPMRIELGASELTQAGTPTPDSPQDIHTISGSNTILVRGKNLFDKNSTLTTGYLTYSDGSLVNDDNFRITDYIPIQPNTNYITSGMNNGSGSNPSRCWYDINKNFISGNKHWENATISYTSPNNAYYMRESFKAVDLDTIQIELGNTATTYEPYNGTDYSVDLKSINLLDVSYFQQGSIDSSTGQDAVNAQNARGENYIPVKPNTKYTISANRVLDSLRLSQYASDKSHIRRDERLTSGLTITTTANTYFVRWSLNYNQSTPTTKELIEGINLMLVEGDKIPNYQPYYDINYSKISTYEDKFIRNSGKNLLDLENATYTKDGITAVVDNGKITLNGTATANSLIYIPVNLVVSAQKYSWSANNPVANSNVILRFDSNIMPDTLEVINKTKSYTFENETSLTYLCIRTTNATTLSNFIIYPQFEVGNASDYEPYGSNEWYIKKNIGKHIMTSDDDLANSSTRTNTFRFTSNIADKLPNVTNTRINIRCNRGSGIPDYYWNTDEVGICEIKNPTLPLIIFSLPINEVNSLTTAKTWFANNETIIYYILKTPTYTKITGTLAEQLEYVYQLLKSYKGVTNISQINNDLSFNLNVQAIEELV